MFWIILVAVLALLIGLTVEFYTREMTTPRAAISRAFVTMVVAPFVFYGIQRVVEAPERLADAQREEKRDELLNDVAARSGNADVARELIELRSRTLFSRSPSDAERFAEELLTELSEKKRHYRALQDASADVITRLSLDWEPFFRAFLEEFDRRVAALRSRGIHLAESTNDAPPLVQTSKPQYTIARDLQVSSRYRLRVFAAPAQVELGKLISYPSFDLVGQIEGSFDRHFIKVVLDPTDVKWEIGSGPDRRTGVEVISGNSQKEKYEQAVRDGLNLAFEYAVLVTTEDSAK